MDILFKINGFSNIGFDLVEMLQFETNHLLTLSEKIFR